MELNPHELEQIVSRMLDQYNDGAEDFWESTRGHDVSQNIGALLRYIEGNPPFTLLDFGCGPGARPQGLGRSRAPRHRLGRRYAFHRDGAGL